MSAWRGAVAGLVALTVAAGSQSLLSTEPAHPVEAAMLRHIDWITANSSFEYDGEDLPDVRFVSQDMLDGLSGGRSGETQAVYHHFINVIYLPAGTDPLAWEVQPVLVHEMVHYLQWVRGTLRGAVCAGRFEPPAYHIMDTWIAEHGHQFPRSDPKTVLGMALECHERGK